MSVTKAELTRINAHLQETIRLLLQENQTLRADTQKLKKALVNSMQQIELLNARFQKLSDYMKRLHEWLHDGVSANKE